jgi:uracil-DNA glycosylase
MSEANVKIHPDWYKILKDMFEMDFFRDLKAFLIDEKKKYKIYPPGKEIFAAFDKTPPETVKVVIIGQDPYPGPKQAHGLCFSVNKGIRHPSSLQNIFKEIENDLGIKYPKSGNLESWASQGVLLLNAVLTVRAYNAGSHRAKGWEIFTDYVITELSRIKKDLVFLLWGNFAKSKRPLIDETKHVVLSAFHPSGLSAHRGFFGCRHFSKTNKILVERGLQPIDWRVE